MRTRADFRERVFRWVVECASTPTKSMIITMGLWVAVANEVAVLVVVAAPMWAWGY